MRNSSEWRLLQSRALKLNGFKTIPRRCCLNLAAERERALNLAKRAGREPAASGGAAELEVLERQFLPSRRRQRAKAEPSRSPVQSAYRLLLFLSPSSQLLLLNTSRRSNMHIGRAFDRKRAPLPGEARTQKLDFTFAELPVRAARECLFAAQFFLYLARQFPGLPKM